MASKTKVIVLSLEILIFAPPKKMSNVFPTPVHIFWVNIPDFISGPTDVTQEQTQDEEEFWDKLTGQNRKRKRVDVNT